MDHHAHHKPQTLLGRIFHFLHSGPGVLASAALGLYVGVTWSLGDLPDQFQLLYISLYRMMALPFLILTIIEDTKIANAALTIIAETNKPDTRNPAPRSSFRAFILEIA